MTPTSLKEHLFHELELGVRTTSRLLARVEPAQWAFRPTERMRSLQELAEHLAALPAVDLLIAREGTEQDVRRLEAEYEAIGTDAAALAEAMRRGAEQAREYYGAMSDATFLTKETKPFYLDRRQPQAQWLVETTTHLFHHRAQLFQYLKQLGHKVNMMDLYVG